MPLVKCPTCDKDVSDKAPACPQCGEPMKSSIEKAQGGAVNMRDPVHFVGICIAGVILLGVAIFAITALNGCASVGHEMDMTQVQRIQKGVTTRADIEKIFGKPISSTGTGNGTSTATWLYSEASNSARNFIPVVNLVTTKIDTKHQMLFVQFDAKSVVTDYNFSEGGTAINAGLVK